MKIALAFSGGGVRATVFQLGVLARLARQDLLGNVTMISSVSGGSLAAGLVFSAAGQRWPSSAEYLHDVVPKILSLLTTRNLQWSFALNSILLPWRLASGRASILGDALEKHWRISGNLADLPSAPRWIINSTCYQTGKNWRFQRDLMGDYQTRYVTDPDFKLSHALAASAAVPGLIGPLVVRTKDYCWSEYCTDRWQPIKPRFHRIHLWDGGVYDNLGVESLFKPSEGLCEGADFLIVCDASRSLANEARQSPFAPEYFKALMRLVDVATDQVRSLRARMLIEYFKQNPGSGVYLRMGRVPKAAYPRRPAENKASLNEEEVRLVARLETTLRRLTHHEFSLLFRHGFEVADATLSNHASDLIQRRDRQNVSFKAA